MKVSRTLALVLVPLAAGGAAAQDAARLAAVPSPEQVLGHALGERFTDHAGVVRYMEALAAAAPEIAEVRRYGETVEGRVLIQVVLASARHRATLDQILAANRELTDPDLPQSRANEISAGNPAILYFSYGVHGNESSSSEAAMWTAWDLVRGATGVAGVLDSAIVVIDPVVNPDGRDRYVNAFRQAVGRAPNPNPESREHFEPWPGGRFNHYLFDLNRDWAWRTQPETRARLATWDTWTPQVHVDFHEMSPNSSYFFFPAAAPINPLYPEHILEWGHYFGEANAAVFDEHGWTYYTGEGFDLFYPGYGDSWPSLLGAIGMTYEQAGGGRAGLAYRRPDGLVLTLRDRATHHRTSGSATLHAATRRKTELLRDFARFHRTVAEGLQDILIVTGPDTSRTEAMLSLLRDQGIVIEQSARAFQASATPHTGFAERRRFPAGTYLVRARQPRGRLAITLLQPEVILDATFSYDVSAWSLPFAYGVEAHSVARAPDAGWTHSQRAAPAPITNGGSHGNGAGAEPYGYLIAPGFENWKHALRYLRAGGRVIVLDEAFTLDGRPWPAGTFFLPRFGVDGFAEKTREAGVLPVAAAIRTGRVDSGNDLGTGRAYALELPRVGVLTGQGISPTSYGAHWYFLEHTLELPFDALPTDQLGSTDLRKYDVLVAAGLARGPIADREVESMRRWLQAGGTLIAADGAARTLGAPLAEIQLREDTSVASDERRRRALLGRAEREQERWEGQVPGTILAVRLDPAHPLAFGTGAAGDPTRLFVLHSGGRVFEPDPAFETVGYFEEQLEKVSGVISQQNLERLGRGSWLAMKRVGQGRVILFADDPIFRHFWYSTFQPYANALLLGPRL